MASDFRDPRLEASPREEVRNSSFFSIRRSNRRGRRHRADRSCRRRALCTPQTNPAPRDKIRARNCVSPHGSEQKDRKVLRHEQHISQARSFPGARYIQYRRRQGGNLSPVAARVARTVPRGRAAVLDPLAAGIGCCATATVIKSPRMTSSRWPAGRRLRGKISKSPSSLRASCCKTSRACPASSIWRRCVAAMKRLGGDPKRINPLIPVDLVIDHSVQVDHFGDSGGAGSQRRTRVRAQSRALRIPALGAEGVRQFPRRAAGRGHRAPGESRVSGQGASFCARTSEAPSPCPTRWSEPTATRR